MYKVINFFTDLQDFRHPYKVGDTYPRHGRTVSEERLQELASDQNKQGRALIEFVADEVEVETAETETATTETVAEETTTEETKTYTKTDIMRMSKAQLVELATEMSIADVETLSAAKLKDAILAQLSL